MDSILYARPRFLAVSALSLLSILSLPLVLTSPHVWPSSGEVSGSGPTAQEEYAVNEMRFRGDMLSGEALHMLSSIERAEPATGRSFADADAPGLLLLTSGAVQEGIVLVPASAASLRDLENLGSRAALPYPGITFVSAQPRSHGVHPASRVYVEARSMVPLALALILSVMTLLFPVLQDFSRLKHVLRGLSDSALAASSAAAASLLAVMVSGLLVEAGSGHAGPGFREIFIVAAAGSVMFLLWERMVGVEDADEPEKAASFVTVTVLALLCIPSAGLSAVIATSASSPALGAASLQLFSSSLALMLSVSLLASIRLLIRSSSWSRERGLYHLHDLVTTARPMVARLFSYRALTAPALLLLSAAAASSPLYMPQADSPTSHSPTILVEVRGRTADTPAPPAAVARLRSDLRESPYLASVREVSSPAGSSSVFLLAEGKVGASAHLMENAVATAPLSSDIRARAAGGSYRAWQEWRDEEPLSVSSMMVMLMLASTAALAAAGHSLFGFSRLAVIGAAPSVAAFMYAAPSMFSSGATPSGLIHASVLATALVSLMALLYGRFCDMGYGGSFSAALLALESLPVLVVLGIVSLLASAHAPALLPVLVSSYLMAVLAALVVAPSPAPGI